MAKILVLTLAIMCRLILTVGLTTFFPPEVRSRLVFDPQELNAASIDYGHMKSVKPLAVFHPNSSEDVAWLVQVAYKSASGFTVSARGNGHCTNGQSQTGRGVVIQMNRRNWLGSVKPPSEPIVSEEFMFVDVWGGELWIDVLNSTLKHGLAPKSWTDYLFISVGGALSNAGIGGQTYYHGPQISNVYELDVVTGKGELVTCSEEQNQELYHAVLGGLGQFGIITRARIALEPAPQRVKWIQVMYSDFTVFSEDQEYLISLNEHRFDYVEGSVIIDGGVQYWIELTKNYNQSTANTIDQEVESMLKKLRYIKGSILINDVTYKDFLNRVYKTELELRSKGLWDVPHPWLNLFIPKSRIADFNKGVFNGILGNKSGSPLLIYPINKNKWNDKNTVVIIEEEVFYTVGLLRPAVNDGNKTDSVIFLENQNRQILEFCKNQGIKIKQYLPKYNTQQEWMTHFGDQWSRIYRLKMKFDPRHILAIGQNIFKPLVF